MSDGTAAVLSAPAAAPVAPPVAAAPPATPAAAPVAAAPPAASSWLDGADELLKGFAQNKGWKSPLEAVTSYKHLESVLGADKSGRTVVLPKPDSTPEELSEFYTKLGRPVDPKDYALPVPPGGTPEFTDAAAKKFHELGVPKDVAQKLTGWMHELANGHVAAGTAAAEAAFKADDVALRAEWGAAFDKNIAAARAAVTSLGVEAASIEKIAASIGHKATMNLFAKIGAKTLEDTFVAGDRTSGFGDAMTPGQAKAQLEVLKTDKDFQSRYFNGDAKARAEMTRLQGFAYPAPPK